MRRFSISIALSIGLLAWPAVALAAPANIAGIGARFVSGEIHIQWIAPDPADGVSLYRIYYGQRSILENDGRYDDSWATAGNNTDFIVTDIPPYPKIFLSVLAVDGDGNESDSFVQEVELTLDQGDSDGVFRDIGEASPSRKDREDAMLGLMSAESRSPTEAWLRFSMPVAVGAHDAAAAIAIVDDASHPLAIRSLRLQNDMIIVTTDAQEPGRHYVVRATDAVLGSPSPDVHATLDPGRSMADMTGFAEVAPASPIAPGSAHSIGAPEAAGERGVRNVRLRFDPEGNGLSTVIIGWDEPSVGEVASYDITPISGNEPSEKANVPSATRVVRLHGVLPGWLRVIIQPVAPDQTRGEPVVASAVIGATEGAPPRLEASVVTPPVRKSGLTSTGAGAAGIAIVSGAAAGWYRARKKAALLEGSAV